MYMTIFVILIILFIGLIFYASIRPMAPWEIEEMIEKEYKLNNKNVKDRQIILPISEIKPCQLWRPIDGSNRLHEIISNNGKIITHRCIETDEIFKKDAFGFQVRYYFKFVIIRL